MRYNSPATQLALVATTLLLTTAIRRLLNNHLLQITPPNTNLTYTQNLTTGILTSLSSIIAIPLTNLAGPRPIFLFYTLTNTLYAASIIIFYQYNTHIYYKIANILNIMGSEFARVVTFGLVLAYPAEKWKARTLAGFLILEYFSITVGDIIAIRNTETPESERFHAAISFLCITSLAPLPVLAMRPSSSSVVRSNGVHLVTRKTTAWREVTQTLRIFINRYMLLLLPYMFSYPFLFGCTNVWFPSILAFVLYDVGKLFIIVLGQMLDVQWAGRRTRGLLGLSILVVFFCVSIGISAALRILKYNLTGLDPLWPQDIQAQFIMDAVLSQQYNALMCSYFFAGTASSFIELFGYWVMGTLTNDLKASARFVGIYHCFMALGGALGFWLPHITRRGGFTSNVPMFVASGLTMVSFIGVGLVVGRIAETNDWTLARINERATVYLEDTGGEVCLDPVVIVPDVKYHQNESHQS